MLVPKYFSKLIHSEKKDFHLNKTRANAYYKKEFYSQCKDNIFETFKQTLKTEKKETRKVKEKEERIDS